MTPLYVDYRGGSCELIQPLQKLELPAEETDLPSADLAFMGRGAGDAVVSVGIEYKKLAEAIGSMRSQRLQGHQAPLMAIQYDFRYLVIETKGSLIWSADGMLLQRKSKMEFEPIPGHMKVSEYFKRLHQLHIQYGLVWSHTHSRRETLKLIETLYWTWTDKSLDEHRSHIAIYRPPSVAPITKFVKIISGFDGISYELGKRLEAHFGTLDALLSAPMEEWMQVEGVGKEKARQMLATLTGASV